VASAEAKLARGKDCHGEAGQPTFENNQKYNVYLQSSWILIQLLLSGSVQYAFIHHTAET